MLELRIIAGQPAIPLFALPATIGRAEAARTVGEQIEAMMAMLDDLDGDPDDEEPGLEDSFVIHRADGPGCPISDVGDPAWIEWDSRGRHRLQSLARDAFGIALHEDDEDADPAEIDDDAEDDDSDRCAAGDDMMRAGPTTHVIDWRPPTSASAGHEPGCEDDAEPENRAALVDQIRSIRGRACTATVNRSYGGLSRTTYRITDPGNAVSLGVASDLLGSA